MHLRFPGGCIIILSIGLTCLFFPGRLMAADEKITALRHEVTTLKQTVQRLEQRISELEKRISTPASAVRYEPGKGSMSEAAAGDQRCPDQVEAQHAIDRGSSQENAPPSLRDHWRRIRQGMTAKEVKDLLGAPQEKFTVAEKTVWYYRYSGHRSGSVTFYSDMQVAGWQTPPASGY